MSASAYGRCPFIGGCRYRVFLKKWPGPQTGVRLREVFQSSPRHCSHGRNISYALNQFFTPTHEVWVYTEFTPGTHKSFVSEWEWVTLRPLPSPPPAIALRTPPSRVENCTPNRGCTSHKPNTKIHACIQASLFDVSALKCMRRSIRGRRFLVFLLPSTALNPFTPKSDQFQISPTASQGIFQHTVLRTWLFIAHSHERWLYYQFSRTH